jgi:hypothetical protein
MDIRWGWGRWRRRGASIGASGGRGSRWRRHVGWGVRMLVFGISELGAERSLVGTWGDVQDDLTAVAR